MSVLKSNPNDSPVRRGRPVMRVLGIDEVATLLELPPSLVSRQMKGGLIPGSFQERESGNWVCGERGLARVLERRVEPHYSYESAAELLELSYDHVWRAAKSGAIAKVRVLGTWRIAESELVRLTRQPSKRGMRPQEDAR